VRYCTLLSATKTPPHDTLLSSGECFYHGADLGRHYNHCMSMAKH